MGKKFKIYNSLNRKKNIFVPIDENNVRIYACGPTVYNYAHIGNARMSVVCDLLVKVLKTIFPKVTYTSNITDIDDKIISEAKKLEKPIKFITEKFTEIYNNNMQSIGNSIPDFQPKATEHIKEIIELINKLIINNNAYVKNNHVMFHVLSYKHYGALSRRTVEQQISGSRVEVAPYKKYPGDFVLWKPSKKDEPGWDSPWGFGRPGWHIECSAMAEKSLELPFDIHAGGADLTFPHHENEIAQSCSINKHNDRPESFSKYWFHNGFVMSDGEKMSKSLGNVRLVNDLLYDFSGPVIRLALIKSHYRQPLNWTENLLVESRNNLKKLMKVFEKKDLIEFPKKNKDQIPDDFLDALYDDLNTPKAFAILSDLINRFLKEGNSTIRNLKLQIYLSSSFLGIFEKNLIKEDEVKLSESNKIVENLILKRNIARKKKQFDLADNIKLELEKMGILIQDTKNKTKWKKEN